MPYDPTNVFARILRGEIPAKKIYEDAHALAFHDISPRAPVHALVIPKGEYKDILDFSQKAGAAQQAGFWQAAARVATELGVADTGFRTIANTGEHGGQEVPHFHIHILGGRPLGHMVQG